MAHLSKKLERKTNADDVFDFLHGQIVSLQLLPGTRISEVEIARQFDVSRQPVREAFIRLANLDLLLIRPQKATMVRRFSSEKIKRARFIRMAVECEILRRACRLATNLHHQRLQQDLESQRAAIRSRDIEKFHSLDYDFHRHLCDAGHSALMFGTISENKALVDRLCVLSLSEPAAMEELFDDHFRIAEKLKEQNEDAVITAITEHLSRLDDVIAGIRNSHADFFED
ncbi:MAG: GntR family transcriptional regulator [Albidovulum sp.]|nr:GntR family transcriptional regulator [Albidovulum sp.]MDE0303531.1 GntR family transcriptional regulator [Albidovulum sp.]MDE0531761.1 GntR family transcriptional regulator [Albidovulum sp.]